MLKQTPSAHVTGVDLAPAMLRMVARTRRAAIAQGRLSLARGDINSLPFSTAVFDKLFTIHTFYFWRIAT